MHLRRRLPAPWPVLLLAALLLAAPVHVRADDEKPTGGERAHLRNGDSARARVGYVHERSAGGPNSVDRTLVRNDVDVPARFDVGLRQALEPYFAFKNRLQNRYGFRFGGDYQALAMTFDETTMGRKHAAGGVFRLYGDWTLVERCSGCNVGALEFRLENRHPYTAVSPGALGAQAGYGGTVGTLFGDTDGFVFTSLHWAQKLGRGDTQILVGLLDQTDLFDMHDLANPFTAFQNLSMVLNPSESIPDQGLGAVVTHWFDSHWGCLAGIHDANAVLGRDGFDTFFGDFETFKYAELGWARSRPERLTHKVNVALWQQDEREEAGVAESWGLALTGAWGLGRYQPFLRAGWSDGPGALARWHVGVGVGCQGLCKSELLGLGLAVDDVNGSLRDEPQWTGEAFYCSQVTDFLQVTPSVQLLAYPAFETQDDLLMLFGIRVRYSW